MRNKGLLEGERKTDPGTDRLPSVCPTRPQIMNNPTFCWAGDAAKHGQATAIIPALEERT